jgi:hypothetical protein
LVDATTLSRVSASSSNFVWVEVSITNLINEGDYSGTITIYTKSIPTESHILSTASWTATGEATNNFYGRSVSSAGDVNGDGYDDVIVGAYGYNSNTGKVYLYLGSASGLSSTHSWDSIGENQDDCYGNSVSSAGDVNGDGYNDVIVGAYGYNSWIGKVYLYLGSASGLSSTPA